MILRHYAAPPIMLHTAATAECSERVYTHSTARTRPRPPTRAPFFERDLRPQLECHEPPIPTLKGSQTRSPAESKSTRIVLETQKIQGSTGRCVGTSVVEGDPGLAQRLCA